MKIINPATAQVIADVKEDTRDSIAAKLSLLQSGQRQWKETSIKNRLDCIIRFGDLIHENKNELSAILTAETGKPIQQSLNEIGGAQNRIEHLKLNAEKWLAPEVLVDYGDTHERIIYEPLGVVANISAWNFPYNVGYNVFLYALVAGNAVLYKPSEYASLTGLQFEKYLMEAGVPADVFQCVIGGGAVGQHLLDMDLGGYFFTGSYATGRQILQSVAHNMVPIQLELGGKDPLYVMDDVADVRQAAINAAEGAFYNNGQSCCAVERIYAHEKIYDAFVASFVEEVNTYKIGDPTSLETFIGPLTRVRQIAVLDGQVKDALEKGAELKCGGGAVGGIGSFYQPTVLVNVDHAMKVMQEESFGPVIGIQKVGSDKEALRLMNDSVYGLTAAVFSQDEQRAVSILSQMNTGTVYWNCCDRVSANVPWSGRKNSGIGATLSSQGIRAFVQPKAYQLRNPN